MGVEEARSVRWLRNNPQPLGELLDEGYLTEQRLAWAAEKAYDPRLKQAAAVLLDWIRQNPRAAKPSAVPSQPEPPPAVNAGLTLEQARATLWPFRPLKGQPMGALMDARQLSVKALAHAIENAWDERVRRAAIALMAVRLNQAVQEPAPAAGPLKVVSGGRSYGEARQLAWASAQGMLVGAISVVWLLLLFIAVKSLASASDGSAVKGALSPAGIIALLLLLALGVGLGWLISRLLESAFDKMGRQIENYRKGQEGEDAVVEALRQSLDGEWTLFRNVVLPGRNRADIDGVLVGPPGIWALEVKTLAGEYRNIGEQWEYRAGNRWRLFRKSPSRQAQDNAARLSSFLKADGIKQWVTAVVIWASRESPLSVENPMVAVWTMDRLPEELGNLWQRQAIAESERTRIVEKLTALCQSGNVEEKD